MVTLNGIRWKRRRHLGTQHRPGQAVHNAAAVAVLIRKQEVSEQPNAAAAHGGLPPLIGAGLVRLHAQPALCTLTYWQNA